MRLRMIVPLYASGFFSFSTGPITGLIIPLWGLQLDAGPLAIGLVVAAGHIGPLFLSLPIGAWCDRFGPKYVMLSSSILAAAVALAFPVFPSIWPVIIMHAAFGVGRAAMWIASQAYLGSAVPSSGAGGNVFGHYAFFVNMGTFAGPAAIAAIIPTLSYGWAFGFLSVWCLACGAAAFWLPPTAQAAAGASTRQAPSSPASLQVMRSALVLAARPAIAFILLATFVRLFSGTVMQSFYPVYLKESGFSEATIGLLIAVGNFVGAILTPLAGKLSGIFGNARALSIAMVSGLLGVGFTPVLAGLGVAALAVGSAVEGAGRTIILPLSLPVISASTAPDERGLAFGLRVMINRVASIVTPLLLGLLSSWLPIAHALLLSTGAMLVVTGIIIMRFTGSRIFAPGSAGYRLKI